ncbi:hypothetical protein, partial [Halioglobus sp. HI00S01]
WATSEKITMNAAGPDYLSDFYCSEGTLYDAIYGLAAGLSTEGRNITVVRSIDLSTGTVSIAIEAG